MKRLVVCLNGVRVGLLSDSDELTFVYEPEWLATGPGYPLSRQLPLQAEPFSGRAVRAFFAGLLPEAEPRDRIASILGVSGGNDFAILERIGGDCAGAVSLFPEDISWTASRTGNLRWLDEADLASLVERLPQQPLLAGEVGLRLSLAGAQIKLPVVLAEDGATAGVRMALPLDGTPSTHILKPEPMRFPGLVANEAWCMALAREVGLRVAESQQRIIGKTPCLIVKRYDRATSADGRVERLHQEDFCQALGFPASRKYQQEGGPSLKDCFNLIREWSSVPVIDIRDFLDGVILAALTGNADAHSKNFSFLYSGRERRLAPLYDQVCTLAWPELSKHLSMKVGTAGTLAEVSPEHFQQLATSARLSWPMVRERLSDMAARVAEACRRLPGSPEGAAKAQMPVRVVLERAERMVRRVRQRVPVGA
jgi:serine/threonine-protein kinase HipA